jgi:hypothetical protein
MGNICNIIGPDRGESNTILHGTYLGSYPRSCYLLLSTSDTTENLVVVAFPFLVVRLIDARFPVSRGFDYKASYQCLHPLDRSVDVFVPRPPQFHYHVRGPTPLQDVPLAERDM